MQVNHVARVAQKTCETIFTTHPVIKSIVAALAAQGARTFLVGGIVRDAFLEQPSKDVDCEVHGISLEVVEHTLHAFGVVRTVGKAFGVLRIDGLDVDWSIPRIDASGRKPAVALDPFLSLQDAFKRRDLTINAMGIDLVTYELVDPFGGLEDLQKKVLRTPDPHFFVQDPLRFYRVMQFIGRFNMHPDIQLTEVCRTMDITGVAQERKAQEFEKLFLKSGQPSLGIRWLAAINRLQEILPEVATLQGVEQWPDYHPEGDVFEHTMQAVDAAASYTYQDQDKKRMIILAALTHDLGKPATKKFEDGRIRFKGHDVAGVEPARHLLARIMVGAKSVQAILKLVRWHMMPVAFVKNNSGPAAYKRLAAKLAPDCTMHDLYMLAQADKSGRNPVQGKPLAQCPEPLLETFFTYAQQYGVAYGPEAAVITGADFLDVCQPGPSLGELVKQAYEVQIERGITDKKKLKEMVLKNKK